MKKRVKIKVYGLVQGVNFRYYTLLEAKKLNLTGWVENEPGGLVAIVAEGEKEDLKKLIDWTKIGSPLAKIEEIEYYFEELKGEKRFEMR